MSKRDPVTGILQYTEDDPTILDAMAHAQGHIDGLAGKMPSPPLTDSTIRRAAYFEGYNEGRSVGGRTMTINDLKRIINALPDSTRVFITSEDDERGPQLVTYDATSRILRLCWDDHGITAPERVLEDYSGASSQFGVGA